MRGLIRSVRGTYSSPARVNSRRRLSTPAYSMVEQWERCAARFPAARFPAARASVRINRLNV